MVAGERDWRRPWGRRLWGCPLQQSPPCSCGSPHRPQSPRPHLSPPRPPEGLVSRGWHCSALSLGAHHCGTKKASQLACSSAFFGAVLSGAPSRSRAMCVSFQHTRAIGLHCAERTRSCLSAPQTRSPSHASGATQRSAGRGLLLPPPALRMAWRGNREPPRVGVGNPSTCGAGRREGPLARLRTHLRRTWRRGSVA